MNSILCGIGVDRVEPGILQAVGAQLVGQAGTPALLGQVEQHAAGLSQAFDTPAQLVAAVASQTA